MEGFLFSLKTNYIRIKRHLMIEVFFFSKLTSDAQNKIISNHWYSCLISTLCMTYLFYFVF